MFLPEASRGALLDRQMRGSLADSVAHVHEAAASALGLSDIDMKAVAAEIRAHRVAPGLFGRYYDLVFAIQAGKAAEARALFRDIAALAGRTPDFSVVPLTDDALGSDASRFARLLSGERGGQVFLGAPSEAAWSGFEARAAQAMRALGTIDPDLAGEVGDLTVQLIGALPTDQGYEFGSASSLMLWGAVVVNLRRHATALDLMAGLVHEAAHQLLFGLSIDEPLVANPIKERYKSPLRSDARPMDGIYHATFVCARLFHLYARLRDAQLDGLDDGELDDRLGEMSRKFQDGSETIARFGRLSPTGERLFADASDYMKRAA